MRIFHHDSPLMTALSKIADLMILNVLWIVCCLPVITAGASTVAMYSCLLCQDNSSVARQFFRAFKSNFLRATALLGIFLFAMVLVAVNLFFYLYLLRELDIWFRILAMLPGALILMVSSYLFPLQARFETSLPQLLKNAVGLTVVHLPSTAAVAFINCFPILLLYFKTDLFVYLLPVWTLVGFALLADLNALFLQKVFRNYLPKEDDENAEDI